MRELRNNLGFMVLGAAIAFIISGVIVSNQGYNVMPETEDNKLTGSADYVMPTTDVVVNETEPETVNTSVVEGEPIFILEDNPFTITEDDHVKLARNAFDIVGFTGKFGSEDTVKLVHYGTDDIVFGIYGVEGTSTYFQIMEKPDGYVIRDESNPKVLYRLNSNFELIEE